MNTWSEPYCGISHCEVNKNGNLMAYITDLNGLFLLGKGKKGSFTVETVDFNSLESAQEAGVIWVTRGV